MSQTLQKLLIEMQLPLLSVVGLLSVVEEELPFYKTTLVESGSFYEGTKVGQPDEFDYFVQLDNFSRPEDIRFEELSQYMVAVIPSDSAMDKFIETKKKCSRYSPLSFQWKRDVKTLFIDTFNNIFGQLGVLQAQEKVATFGLKALPRALDRHGPAYTLELEWCKGQLYKGLKTKIDLTLAVKINSRSSTMKVDFESATGKVLKSLLYTLPYYFAVSGYTDYDVPPSNLFKEFEDKQNRFIFDIVINHFLNMYSYCSVTVVVLTLSQLFLPARTRCCVTGLEVGTRITTLHHQTCLTNPKNPKNHRNAQKETVQCHYKVNLISFYVFLSHVLNSHCSVTILVLMVDQVFVSGC